ncbi:MAG: transcriptional regulator, AraC family [Cytophagaceae bacterium]|jgi:AraC-like DNA-binding protein|nr:transcriptional regulator, AraC family [Cytophagaceae bacterium]
MLHKKLITICLIATAMVVIIMGGLLYRTDSLVVIPFSSSSTIAINTYHEEGAVFSKASCQRTDKGITFDYTLSNAFPEPFAAIYIRDTITAQHFFDATSYDMLEVKLKATKGTRIPITFRVSKKLVIGNDSVDVIPYVLVVNHSGADTTYKLRLSNFKVASWWLRYYKLPGTDFEKPDLAHVGDFVIGSCQALGPDIPDSITISDLRFAHSNRTLLIVIGSILALLVSAGVYINLLRKKQVNSLQIAYTPLPLSDTQNNEFGKIADFIAKNYPNAELSLTDVQNGVGINGKAISRLIKENLQISFTDYLNQLRITEVKRLLKETKLPISDIAYKVGYNNISHFNRVFKGITGKTPKAFREEEV